MSNLPVGYLVDIATSLTTTNALLAEVRDALESLVGGLEDLEGLPEEVRTLREETHELRLKLTPWKPEAQR